MFAVAIDRDADLCIDAVKVSPKFKRKIGSFFIVVGECVLAFVSFVDRLVHFVRGFGVFVAEAKACVKVEWELFKEGPEQAAAVAAPKVVLAFAHAHSLQVDHQVVVADASNQHNWSLVAYACTGTKAPVSGETKNRGKKDYKKQGSKKSTKHSPNIDKTYDYTRKNLFLFLYCFA